MTDVVKLVNDVSYLYEDGLILSDGKFICPVCKKEYKRKKSAEKHVSNQDCYSVRDMFDGTTYEMKGYQLFQSIMSKEKPSARTTLSTFKKSKSYSPILRFILFVSYHEIADKGLYYSYLNEIVGFKYMNKILAEGIKESRLREFRKFLQKNPCLIDSKSFDEKYRDDLIEDDHFMIRSIEKGHIAVEYLIESDFPFDDVCGRMSQDYYHRMLEMVE